jgi:endoglucanase
MKRVLGLSFALALMCGCTSEDAPQSSTTPITAQKTEAVNPIYVNQHGFAPNSPKLAFYRGALKQPVPWTLHDQNGDIVLQGQTRPLGYSKTADQVLNEIDFSDFEAPGESYYLTIEGVKSPTFDIAKGLYKSLKYDALAYFYHARAGEPITAPYVAHEHERPAGHENEVVTCFKGEDMWGTVWPGCDYTLDVTGGWYDAGDHGKYVVNSGISTWTLLNAYEHFGAAFADGMVNIPEAGNGVNDLLDEARKNIEWMLSMQVPEGTKLLLPIGQQEEGKALTLTEVDAGGMVHHKVHDEKWTDGTTMPHQSKERRYLYPPSTGATLNLAAIGAQCARIYKSIDPQFAGECMEASKKAVLAAFRNPQTFSYNNFDGGGPYSDKDFNDEQAWVDDEFQLTSLSSKLRNPVWPETNLTMGFNNTEVLGRLSRSVAEPNLNIEKLRVILDLDIPSETSAQSVVYLANSYLAETAQEKLHIPFYKEKYSWGGNSELANRAIVLGTAYQLTGEKKYRDGVVHLMDYLLGRNPMGVSYITAYGDKPFENPHHRFWAKSIDPTRPDPPAGVLSGGPNNDNMADPIAQTMVGTCAAQTCWVDDHGAWSLNEVTINWNAPLFWMAAFLDATEDNE